MRKLYTTLGTFLIAILMAPAIAIETEPVPILSNADTIAYPQTLNETLHGESAPDMSGVVLWQAFRPAGAQQGNTTNSHFLSPAAAADCYLDKRLSFAIPIAATAA